MSTSASHKQNRVDPSGRIVADPARGTLMGNRGCLHDEQGRIVRASARPAWITCVLQYRGIQRTIMQPGRYTELFFLDEATALAAGHRPCGMCRVDALQAFKRAWQRAFGLARLPYVDEIDPVLRAAAPAAAADPASLPDGAMVAIGNTPHLLWQGAAWPWSFAGYADAVAVPSAPMRVLTPAPMLAVLRAGYVPLVHPSARQGRHAAPALARLP